MANEECRGASGRAKRYKLEGHAVSYAMAGRRRSPQDRMPSTGGPMLTHAELHRASLR